MSLWYFDPNPFPFFGYTVVSTTSDGFGCDCKCGKGKKDSSWYKGMMKYCDKKIKEHEEHASLWVEAYEKYEKIVKEIEKDG